MSKRRIRFSLAGLLLVTTAIAAFLGYSQWRRQNILRQVEAIEQLGGRVNLPNGYADVLWQRRPRRGYIASHFGDEENAEAIKGDMREVGVRHFAEVIREKPE